MPVHKIEQTVYTGKPLQSASKAMIMIHGRGASAASILPLADSLAVSDFALIAPNASGGTWYPYSFLAPEAQNEPYLTSALDLIKAIVDDLTSKGFQPKDLYFAGFSQGACLTAEFIGRHANRYGGAFIFTGGVIGERVHPERYTGDFAGTPIFLGSGNPDFHVPVERVYATGNIFRNLEAEVVEKIYPNRPHTIVEDEIRQANLILQTARQ
jgi:phospholipase/carboxylesterase